MYRLRSLARPAAVALLTLGAAASLAVAGAEPRSFREAAVASLSAVPRWTAPAIDVARLRDEDAAARAAGLKDRPPRVGFPMKAALRPSRAGAWEELSDGSRVWRLRVASPGALWIVLGFGAFRPAAGAELWIYTPDRARILGPFTSADERTTAPLAAAGRRRRAGRRAGLAGGGAGRRADGRARHRSRTATSRGADRPGRQGRARIGTPARATSTSTARPARPGRTRSAASSTCSRGGERLLHRVADRDHRAGLPELRPDRRALPQHRRRGELDDLPVQLRAPGLRRGHGAAPDQTVTGSTLRATWGPPTSPWSSSPAGPRGVQRVLQRLDRAPRRRPPRRGGSTTRDGDVEEDLALAQPPDRRHLLRPRPLARPLAGGPQRGGDRRRILRLAALRPGQPDRRPAPRRRLQLRGLAIAMWDEYGKFDLSWTGGGRPSRACPSWLDPAGTGVLVQDGVDGDYCRIPRPRLEYRSSVVDDAAGNADGVADPGETFALKVTERNAGTLGATGVSGTLATIDPARRAAGQRVAVARHPGGAAARVVVAALHRAARPLDRLRRDHRLPPRHRRARGPRGGELRLHPLRRCAGRERALRGRRGGRGGGLDDASRRGECRVLDRDQLGAQPDARLVRQRPRVAGRSAALHGAVERAPARGAGSGSGTATTPRPTTTAACSSTARTAGRGPTPGR